MARERAATRALNSRNAKSVCPKRLMRALDLVRTEQYSAEQSAAKCAISHETIYSYIYADKSQGGTFFTHLRRKRRARKSRASGHERRGRLPDIRPISQRPEHIEAKQTRWALRARLGGVWGSQGHHCDHGRTQMWFLCPGVSPRAQRAHG